MKIVAIRPEPGLQATLAAGREQGLRITGDPLFSVAPLEWRVADIARYDGVLLGSANAIRHGGPELARLTGLPAYVVGEKTADAARQVGFRVAATGQGGLQSVLDDLCPGARRLLRLAGESRVPLVAPPECAIDTVTVYRVDSLPIPSRLAALLEGGAIVLLHSGDAARHFSNECNRLEIDRAKVCIAALAPRIADAAGDGWKRRECAAEVSEPALLALTQDMCQ